MNEKCKCICCEAEFLPRGYCFYDLCDKCFADFDNQKMIGRFGLSMGKSVNPYFESAREWVQHTRPASGCACQDGESFMQMVYAALDRVSKKVDS